ncbi:virginiamycin B lyase family protein [Cystobacter ferrugineus]|uniref:Virginiamycin B lyase n=1 Tax=Cystobacter ferrugineus TaxID=83449 RepID=A0A1L9BB95_9BACT|nr:hypothetical protein [Cystobacter ferrugineus]OJH39536.1 hypothetical protein BON30_18750 [Cystobacter ferrugineus]
MSHAQLPAAEGRALMMRNGYISINANHVESFQAALNDPANQQGHITEFPLSRPGARPHVIVTGPDGALWFTQWGSNHIGRMTTKGAVTEYAIPTAQAEPHGIAVGPDGALWFAEEAGQIGHLVPG